MCAITIFISALHSIAVSLIGFLGGPNFEDASQCYQRCPCPIIHSGHFLCGARCLLLVDD